MRYIVLFIMLFVSLCSSGQKKKEAGDVKKPSREMTYDGMTLKQYYFVMLTRKADKPVINDTSVLNKLQAGHMANIKRLYNDGKILVAGPFADDSTWRGIFIFDCDTQQEVETLLATDPLIKAGRLGYEVHPWITQKNSVFK